MFVTIEGVEGSGKSTLISGLAQRVRARGRELFVTHEPGGTPVGEAVRSIFLEPGVRLGALTEALLVNAARAEHVAAAIRPALAAGRVVICDRFLDSTVAYQGFGRGFDLGVLAQLGQIATGGLVPDRTFVLDIPIGVLRARLAARGGAADRLEAESDAFHERVRAGFLHLASGAPRYRVLDGTLAPETLVESVMLDMFGAVAH